MRGYQLSKHGDAQHLVLGTFPDPEPAANEVCVKTEAIGLNYAEIQSRRGLYGWSPKLPYILGMEATGVIEKLGEGVTTHAVGDRVIIAAQYGCYADRVCVPARQALPAVFGWRHVENAAFAVNYMTAWVALKKLIKLSAGESILINAAAGGVGSAAVQLARALGATVYGGVGSNDKMDLVRSLGAVDVVNYRKRTFDKKLRKLTHGEGVDAVIEVVGGTVFRKSLGLLKPFGHLAVMGFASLDLNKLNPLSWWKTWRAIPRVKVNQLAMDSRMVGASHLGYLLNNPRLLPELWTELTTFCNEHGIKPVLGHEFAFTQMAQAHELMESRRSQGKIVVRVTDS